MTSEVMKVWVQGGTARGDIIRMLYNYGAIKFKGTAGIEDADMVVYTGGADVSPLLYGEPFLQGTYVDQAQDKRDIECFERAKALNKFQVGICRGSQFLNVMNGGKLWQDINNHGRNHIIQDVLSKKCFEASSTHHQQSILNPGKGLLLAYANEATRKKSPDGHWIAERGSPSVDVEAFWYEDTRCLGVQWHPEWGPLECTEWFFYYIETFRKPLMERNNEDHKVG